MLAVATETRMQEGSIFGAATTRPSDGCGRTSGRREQVSQSAAVNGGGGRDGRGGVGAGLGWAGGKYAFALLEVSRVWST